MIMGSVFYFDWEVKLMEWVQSFENEFLTMLGKGVTVLGEDYLLILIIGTVYWAINKELGRSILLSLSGTMTCGAMIKGFVKRRRPYMDNKGVKCIRPAHPDGDIMKVSAQGYSMPSLHASMSTSAYGKLGVASKNKTWLILGILLPLLIGLSRIYLGVHYPTDVLAGWALGIVVMWSLAIVEKKYGYKIGFLVVLIVGIIGLIFCHGKEFYSSYGTTAGLLVGFIYEEKRVNFEKANKWWKIIVRPLLGVIIFAAMNNLLKLPVSGLGLEENNLFILGYRLFRYALSTFIVIGVYPHVFAKTSKN